MEKKRGNGFSLVELLVCMAIISILAAMYMTALSKARRKAVEVVVKESLRQDYMGGMAGSVNSATARNESWTPRQAYRDAFRKRMTTSNGPFWATELLCEIEDEGAFKAYWNTVVNPAAHDELEFRDGNLVAHDENGKEYLLKPCSFMSRIGPPVAVSWEFISTDLHETSAGTLGTNVIYSDGHVEYVSYPGNYPACRVVAERSHLFMMGKT